MMHRRYFDPAKAVIISHFDGHGVASAVLLSKKLGIPKTNIIAKFPYTGPNQFSQLPQLYSFSNYNHIYIVDIAVDIKNPQQFISTIHAIFHQAKPLNERIYFVYIDHHETSIPYLSQFPLFVHILFMPSSYALNTLVSPTPDDDLVYIGAICDRDPTVLKYIPQSRYNELYEASLGLDVLVRKDISQAIKIADNTKALINYSTEVPEPAQYYTLNNVVVVEEQLPPAWGFKSLEKIAVRENKIYAVGWTISNQTKQPVILAIKRWDKEGADIVSLLGENPENRQSYGHPSARTIAAFSEDDAKKFAETVAKKIDTKISVTSNISKMTDDQLAKLADLLSQL